MEETGTQGPDWAPLKSALSLGPGEIDNFTFLGVMICHSGERIYIYKDLLSQRRVFVDRWGNFHCGSCLGTREH